MDVGVCKTVLSLKNCVSATETAILGKIKVVSVIL